MENWPNFFIVGAPKAGTTSLREYLIQHPEIFMSAKKEPKFFCSQEYRGPKIFGHITNKEDYLKIFKNAKNEKIIGEATARYLSDPQAPSKIHQVSPHAKILISLRDPVERAFSNYLMYRYNTRIIKSSLNDEIKNYLENGLKDKKPHIGLETGFYFEGVKKYLKFFGDKQVKIIIFEEWTKNAKNTIKDILKFLEVNTSYDFDEVVRNPFTVTSSTFSKKILWSKSIKKIADVALSNSIKKSLKEKFLQKNQSKPKMSSKDRELLIKLYRDDVEKLKKMLGLKLSWPNFSNF